MNDQPQLVSIEIRPYGLDSLVALLNKHNVTEITVCELKHFTLGQKFSSNDFMPRCRVEFIAKGDSCDLGSLRGALEAPVHAKYVTGAVITPILNQWFN